MKHKYFVQCTVSFETPVQGFRLMEELNDKCQQVSRVPKGMGEEGWVVWVGKRQDAYMRKKERITRKQWPRVEQNGEINECVEKMMNVYGLFLN